MAEPTFPNSETRAGKTTRVRLVWRWRESGTTGSGPWSHRTDVVAVMAATLNQRFSDRMDHWVEAERDERC